MSTDGREAASPPSPSSRELRQAICDVVEHNRRLGEERAALRETLSRLEEERLELLQRSAAAEEDDRELTAQIEARRARLRDTRDQTAALGEECAVLEVDIGGIRRQLDRLHGEEAELTRQLERARELTGEARDALEEARASIVRMDFRLRHDRR